MTGQGPSKDSETAVLGRIVSLDMPSGDAQAQPVLARVLLAEDDPRLQSLGRKVLERQGYNVSLANDGEEAVALAADNDFDVILMDLSMPKMDGYEAMRKIKSIKPMMPVVAVTAHAMKSDRERCLEEGFDEHLSKPYEVPQLVAVVASFASDWARSLPTLREVAGNPEAVAALTPIPNLPETPNGEDGETPEPTAEVPPSEVPAEEHAAK